MALLFLGGCSGDIERGAGGDDPAGLPGQPGNAAPTPDSTDGGLGSINGAQGSDAATGDAASGAVPGDDDDPDGAGAGDGSGDGTQCGLAGCGQTLVPDSGRVDLLFVVDDSASMREEQEALAREFPRMLRKLTSGDHDEDGEPEYTPVDDLHLAVVSTNMGTQIDAVPGCSAGGDSGRLRTGPRDSCNVEPGPGFISYEAASGDPDTTADVFACVAVLGTSGCGFEQPLESALKALWPSADPTLRFLGVGEDSFGRGDRDNAGFLRNDPADPATLGVVIVSDEDDCSAFDSRIFLPTHLLSSDDPLVGQDLNLRCFMNQDRLYALERYLHGYRGLHGFTGARVLFAAIVGVPVDLVDQIALDEVDWNDDAAREAHYQKILDDARMEQRPDPLRPPGAGELLPSCESEHGKAFPPRRIVELARSFGPNSLVQSICGDNLGPPIDLIIRNVVDRPD